MRMDGRYDKRRVTFHNAVAVLFVAYPATPLVNPLQVARYTTVCFEQNRYGFLRVT